MPTALAQAALPSARNSIASASAPADFFQAFITNTSLTPVTAMVSMPLALIAAAFFTKPGRWLLLQVGVKAPGTANSTTFLPLNNSSVVFGFGPSPVITVKVPLGTRSPTLIAILVSSRRVMDFAGRSNYRMIPKKPAPDLIRGGNRFPDK